MSKMSYRGKIAVNLLLIVTLTFLISLIYPMGYFSSDHQTDSIIRSNLCQEGEIVYQMKHQMSIYGGSDRYDVHTILKYEDEYVYLVTADDYNNQQTKVHDLVFDDGLCVIPMFEYTEGMENYVYVGVISTNDAVEKIVVETVDTDGAKPSIFTILEKAEADGVNIFVGETEEIQRYSPVIYDGFSYDRTARGYDKDGNLIAENLCGYAKSTQ